MNKRFFVYLYFLFLFCGLRQFCAATQAVGDEMPQKSLRELKSEMLFEFESKSETLKCDIKILEDELISLKSGVYEQRRQQVESVLNVAKQDLASVQKKMKKLARIFNKRPSGALFDWRKTLFYSINTTFILGAGFVVYKVFQKINSNADLGERKKAFMLAGGVVGVLLLVQF